MTEDSTEQEQSPLEEVAAEPNLDVLFAEQAQLDDRALRFFVRKEREAMRQYQARIEKRNL